MLLASLLASQAEAFSALIPFAAQTKASASALAFTFVHIFFCTDIVAAHGYFCHLIFQYASFNNSHALHFFLATWHVIGIWLMAMGISTMTFNLNGFNFNQAIIDSEGCVINTSAEIINCADLGMEVIHECNAHNFCLDLASSEVLPVAMTVLLLKPNLSS